MIPATYRASFSYLLRHPWQGALALLGVGVGVAVIVAVDLANSSARKAFLLSMDTVAGEATHQVIGGPRGIREETYAELRVEDGLRSIAPIVEGTALINGVSFSLLGVDSFAEQSMRSFTAAAESTVDGETPDPETLFVGLLTDPGSVLISSQAAAELGLAIGDTFKAVANGREQSARLLATFPDDSGSLDRWLVVDIATAQEWLGEAGWLTRIDARIADESERELAALESALPAGTRVLAAAGRTRSTAEMSRAFMTNLTAMSLLALLVGIFLIFNSVNFSVVQRRDLIGVLRALGLSRRQLLTMVIGEAALVGLVAAALGVLLGIVLGEQLLALVSRTINDLYFRVSVTDVDVGVFTVAKGLIAGLGAAILAAALPAIEATSYSPRLSLARSTLEQHTRRSLPAITLVGLFGIAAAVVLLLASGTNLFAGLVAVFLLILGFALCVPLGVNIASNLAAPIGDFFGGTTGRMAVAGIASGLSRTGIAIVALSVAVSATIGVSIMVDSFRVSVSAWLDDSLQADIYVGVASGSLEPGLAADIGALDGVEAMSTSRRVWLEETGGRTQLRIIQMAPGSFAGVELLDADPDAVWQSWERADTVLISEPDAYHNGVGAGDTIALPTDSGSRDFRVAATFQSFDVNASVVMMSRSTYAVHFADDRIDSVGLYLEEGVDPDSIIGRVQATAAGRQAIRVASNTGIREESLRIFDRTFVITDVLYWLTLGVAFIGILSAMLALQLERAREFATLRALGMTPAQVGSMIAAQTGVIGLLAGLASVPLGIGMAWVLIKVINRRAFGWQIDMTVALDVIAVSVAFAIGAALLAGLYPAYRAGQSQPSIVMREE